MTFQMTNTKIVQNNCIALSLFCMNKEWPKWSRHKLENCLKESFYFYQRYLIYSLNTSKNITWVQQPRVNNHFLKRKSRDNLSESLPLWLSLPWPLTCLVVKTDSIAKSKSHTDCQLPSRNGAPFLNHLIWDLGELCRNGALFSCYDLPKLLTDLPGWLTCQSQTVVRLINQIKIAFLIYQLWQHLFFYDLGTKKRWSR